MQSQPYHQSESSVSSVSSQEIVEAVNRPFDSSPVFPPQDQDSSIDIPPVEHFSGVHHSQPSIQPKQRRPEATPNQRNSLFEST